MYPAFPTNPHAITLYLFALMMFPGLFHLAASPQGSSVFWASLSVLLWIGMPFALRNVIPFWLTSSVLGQILLFVALTVWNLIRKKPEQKIVK